MPLTRYQIRNEFSLADPELYKAADRDDPEALLEGVAMAGLVGILRQLGDLAEFAAEIFHDLHEEVMVTAARGHELMVRVQQLEVEFPSIEMAFLSQTNHSSLFTSTGVEWHPNLRMEQNLVTRGDLPRCVMDSYEECRGPPRLFLLDKFDVAGAGACLKRYTDPSFFKVEAAVEVQRERKIRKVKKKGSRWRSGETPEIVPTSHAKLHQLFLEEKVEKGQSDPARLVKLKKRQLSPLDTKAGKSYMEKFLEASEHNVVREISVTPLALKLTSDNSSDSGLEIHDISTVSPVKKSTQGKESTRNSQEVVRNPSIDEFYGEVIDRQIVKMPEPTADDETDAIPSVPLKVTVEKEIAVDREGKMDGSVDGDNSDDMTSEVDNYMDALTTMESEMETDNEYRPKTGMGFLNVEKREMDSGKNDEQLESRAHFSDSQSIGNFSASDDGNSSVKKGRSSFSYSDTLSNLAENTPSDGEGSAKVSPSSEAFVADITEIPSSHDLKLSNDMSVDVCAASSSYLVDSKPSLLQFDFAASSQQHKLDETPSESIKPCSESSYVEESETNLVNSSAVASEMSFQRKDGAVFTHYAESHPVDKLDDRDPSVSFDAVLHLSNNLDLTHEKKSTDDSADDSFPENLVIIKVDSPESVNSPRKEQVALLAIHEAEICSGSASLPANSNVELDDLISEVNDAFPESGAHSETSTSIVDASQTPSSKEQQVSNIEDNIPCIGLDSTEKTALYSEEANLEDISRAADSEKIGELTCEDHSVKGDEVSLVLPCKSIDCLALEDHDGLDDVVAESVIAENLVVPTIAVDDVPTTTSADDTVDHVVSLPQDSICSPSSNIENLQESHFGSEDPTQEGLECIEPIFPAHVEGSEAEKEMSHLDVDSTSCKLAPDDNTYLKVVDDDSSLADCTQNRMVEGDAIIAQPSSAPGDQELECLHQDGLLEEADCVTSSPAGHLPNPEICFQQSLVLQADQFDGELSKAEEANSSSSQHQSELIQSSNLTDHERLFNDASESCQEEIPSEPSPSDDLAQSAGQEIISVEQTMDPLGSVPPWFGLLHEATPVNMEEIPPLPPLPPMQWRLGKIQDTPLISQQEPIGHSQKSFPSILPFKNDEKAQFGFPDQQRGIVQSGNPFLPLTAVGVEELQVSEQKVGNTGQPTTSLQMLTKINQANDKESSVTLEETQSLSPLLTSAVLADEKCDGFLASGGEVVQSSSNPFLSEPADGHTASDDEPVSSHGELIHPQDQSIPETGLEHNTLQSTSQNSEGGLLTSTVLADEKRDGFLASGGEAAQSSSNPFLSEPADGHTASDDEPVSSQGELIHPQHQSIPETGLERNTLQSTSQNSEGGLLTSTVLADEKHDGFLASGGEVVQSSSNPFLSEPADGHTASDDEPVSSQGELIHPQDQSIPETGLERNTLQSTSQNSEGGLLTSAVLADEKLDGFLASGAEVVQLSSNPFLSEPADGHTASDDETVSSQGEIIHPQDQLIPETGLECNTLQSTSQNSEGGHDNISNTLVLPPRKVQEQPQHYLPTSEGESAWSSNPFVFLATSGVGNANGGSVVKLPRPRNPLIDDLAAVDKSKLRKVTERVRPRIEPKLDERDSLLEQIRTKSFNLKPAVLSRPSVQFPKTNLKVAAILEKANAIRQATAGSDEDDEDSWSDS
ncbi:protein SCAR2-like isoform X2 [Mangifera indica]|uniref:protein SCAR2-like isoform X2 n=1 Tax=Mangifera indica TaxID=29780 RepID=UPI001CFB2A17|nr:protein SCAR2-like isoform X2 [Mangifera indica]